MFHRAFDKADRCAPVWVYTILDRHDCTATVAWRYRPRGKKIYACYFTACHRIAINTFTNEKNTHLLWVVLHEMAHALYDDTQDEKEYQTRLTAWRNKLKELNAKGIYPGWGNSKGLLPRPKRNHHPQGFWDIAIPLFKEYGVVGEALRCEYASGKKLLNPQYRPLRRKRL